MTSELEKTGLATVDRFLSTWNSRDALAWAGSLNFPHVRPSPSGPINVIATAEQYATNFDYNTVLKTGWDHSEWDYQHVLHTSSRKIHVAGQWSRYNASGQIILSTPIVYICTCIDGKWGVQSRFGSDYADDEIDTAGFAVRGLGLITEFAHHYGSGNTAACAGLLNYPHFEIEAGELRETLSPDQFQITGNGIHIESLEAVQTGQYSMNVAVELKTNNTAKGSTEKDQVRQGVINITNRNDHLGIQAWSFLNPEESQD